MFYRILLLVSVAIFFCAGKSGPYQPSCVGMSGIQACPLNYSPVCGSNGITYPNECFLCIYRLETNTDILIVKDGPC
uniref:Kazal-like domain-containing protein n=1 Tax=Amphilophus citrinellus TaxID=61819 RepID=A0A3Q0RVM0_AMPCI